MTLDQASIEASAKKTVKELDQSFHANTHEGDANAAAKKLHEAVDKFQKDNPNDAKGLQTFSEAIKNNKTLQDGGFIPALELAYSKQSHTHTETTSGGHAGSVTRDVTSVNASTVLADTQSKDIFLRDAASLITKSVSADDLKNGVTGEKMDDIIRNHKDQGVSTLDSANVLFSKVGENKDGRNDDLITYLDRGAALRSFTRGHEDTYREDGKISDANLKDYMKKSENRSALSDEELKYYTPEKVAAVKALHDNWNKEPLKSIEDGGWLGTPSNMQISRLKDYQSKELKTASAST